MTPLPTRIPAAVALAGLAALASGCLGSSAPAPAGPTPTTRVTVSYRADGVRVHRQLACDPPAGDYPDPAAACAALRDFDRALRGPLPARSAACGCIVPVGPIGAVVGKLDGQAVYLPLAFWVPRAGRDISVLTAGQR
ncbi:MAG TPA: SSI family serine proteinase inhibitor [Gaiellales bacterium]|nr:SSI family serine proteinase inhibitor [Gaiellales bacterium]